MIAGCEAGFARLNGKFNTCKNKPSQNQRVTLLTDNALPVFEAARAGFIHLRENFRESLFPALITALAGAFLQFLVWKSPGLALLLPLASAMVGVPFLAGQYRRALGLGGAALRLGGDEASLAGATLAIGFFTLIIVVIGGFFALIAASIGLMAIGVDIKALSQEPQAFLKAIGPSGSLLLLFCLVPLIVALIWINGRLVCFGAASVTRKRIMAFSTWGWTKGSALRIVAAGLLLGFPLALGVMITFTAARALLLGFGAEPAEMFASHPVPAFLSSVIEQFAGLVLLSGPMAGQAAFLYRGFNPSGRNGDTDTPNPMLG